MRAAALAAVAALTLVPSLPAQSPDSLIAAGVRAYRNLDFDAAAGLLTRAHTLLSPTPDTARRAEVLTYLGASEVYRGRPDSARAIFRRAIRLAPGYRIDRLIFPPEVTVVFDGARRATPAVGARIAREQRFRIGQESFEGALLGSTFHEIRVDVQRPDASTVRALYAGPISDSLALTWDGRSADGVPVMGGRYQLSITSLDSVGGAARILRIPLDITASRQDTLPLPVVPDPQVQLLRAGGSPEALVGGLLAGVAVALLPSAVAPDASLSGGRFAVSGILAVAGVVGYIASRGGGVSAAEAAARDSLIMARRTEREAAAAENVRRRTTADLVVRLGTPLVIDREGT